MNLYFKQQRNIDGVCSWELYCERTLGSGQKEKVEILNRFLNHRGNVLCHIVGLSSLFVFILCSLPAFTFSFPFLWMFSHFCSILNKRFVFSKSLSAMESAFWSLCLLTMTHCLCCIRIHCDIANKSYIEHTEMVENSWDTTNKKVTSVSDFSYHKRRISKKKFFKKGNRPVWVCEKCESLNTVISIKFNKHF